MAFPSVIHLLALLLLQTLPASTHFLSPLISPLYDEVCKEVECGKGICKPSDDSIFLFECDCNHGWKQPLSALDEGLKFLPCIVPNCTLNYSCSEAAAPVQHNKGKANELIFDVCHWVDCGGGSCNKTSLFSYTCNCDAGYFNLLNVTVFPCFRECALDFGCSNFGIPMTNSSTAPPTAPPPTLDENGSSIERRSSQWLLILMIIIANVCS